MKKIFLKAGHNFILCFFLCAGAGAFADPCKILVIVGMEDERAIVASDKDQSIEVVVGVANAAILQEHLQKVDASNIKAVFSFGVAGALDPALKPGDLLLSTQVFSQISDVGDKAMDVSWQIDNNLLMMTYIRAEKAGLKISKGIFFGTDTEAREQMVDVVANLYTATGAQVIDNESHIAAQFASEHNLPFLAIRAVSDSAHHPLPPAALLPLDVQDGSPDGWAITKSLLLNPLQIPALVRAALNYRKALRTLRAFQDKVGLHNLVPANNQECLKGSQLSVSLL